MSAKILEALEKLDPNNDNHWTSDGSPRLDTLKILTGNPGLKRESVTEAAPDFSRVKALAGAGGTTLAPPVPPPPPAPPAPPVVGKVAAAEYPAVAAAAMAVDDEDAEDLRAQVKEAEGQLSDAQDKLQAAQQELVEAQNHLAQLQEKLADSPRNTANPFTEYLKRQLLNLQDRAKKKESIEQSGIDLKELASSLRSPLDEALKSRNRHSRRM